MTSIRKARWWEEAVARIMSMQSSTVLRAVSTPMVISVPYMSLSMVPGAPMTLIPDS